MRHYHVFTKQEKTVENSSLIQHMHKYHENIIHQTGEFIPSSKVEQFANNLKISRQINYAELGRSDLSASEFYYKTMRIGLKSSVSTDTHQMKISVSLLNSADTFVAISNSAKQKNLDQHLILLVTEGRMLPLLQIMKVVLLLNLQT